MIPRLTKLMSLHTHVISTTGEKTALRCFARDSELIAFFSLLDMLGLDVLSVGNGVPHHYMEWYVAVLVQETCLVVILVLTLHNS